MLSAVPLDCFCGITCAAGASGIARALRLQMLTLSETRLVLTSAESPRQWETALELCAACTVTWRQRGGHWSVWMSDVGKYCMFKLTRRAVAQ